MLIDAKISLVLDCWFSLFRQSFLAITGYFIDLEWNLYKVLLGFEFVNEEYLGRALSRIVINVLESFNIRDRVLAFITDNASNNLTLFDSLNKLLAKSINDIFVKDIIRLPYLAYVI